MCYCMLIATHYNDVIMGAMASQIISLRIVYSNVYSGADGRKHQSFASLAFVRGIHRWPVNSPHKWPVTRKMFPFDNFIMTTQIAKFMGPTWGPPGSCRPQMGPMLAPLILLLGKYPVMTCAGPGHSWSVYTYISKEPNQYSRCDTPFLGALFPVANMAFWKY